MSEFSFKCPKCGTEKCVFEELRGSSGGITAMFDLDVQVLTLVVCVQCRFAETYSVDLGQFLHVHGIQGRSWEKS